MVTKQDDMMMKWGEEEDVESDGGEREYWEGDDDEAEARWWLWNEKNFNVKAVMMKEKHYRWFWWSIGADKEWGDEGADEGHDDE